MPRSRFMTILVPSVGALLSVGLLALLVRSWMPAPLPTVVHGGPQAVVDCLAHTTTGCALDPASMATAHHMRPKVLDEKLQAHAPLFALGHGHDGRTTRVLLAFADTGEHLWYVDAADFVPHSRLLDMVSDPNTAAAARVMRQNFLNHQVTVVADGSEHESQPSVLSGLGFLYSGYSLLARATQEAL